MASADPLAGYPDSLPASNAPDARRYLRDPECFAVLGDRPGPAVGAIVRSFADDRIHILRGPVAAALPTVPAGALRPVYRLDGTGSEAVPTGRVWVRFATGIDPRTREEELRTKGFGIEDIPVYAASSAWLAPAGGQVVAGLAAAGEVAGLGGVVAVEPEMIRPSR